MADSISRGSLDCYFVLGVRPDATSEEIEAAYKKAVATLPERGFARWLAAFWFNRNADNIRHAYQTLADPASRERFDAWRKAALMLNFSPPF